MYNVPGIKHTMYVNSQQSKTEQPNFEHTMICCWWAATGTSHRYIVKYPVKLQNWPHHQRLLNSMSLSPWAGLDGVLGMCLTRRLAKLPRTLLVNGGVGETAAREWDGLEGSPTCCLGRVASRSFANLCMTRLWHG